MKTKKSEIVGFVTSLLVDSSLVFSNVKKEVGVAESVKAPVDSIVVDDSVELVVDETSILVFENNFDGVVSSIVVIGLADVVEIIVSSPVEDSFGTVVDSEIKVLVGNVVVSLVSCKFRLVESLDDASLVKIIVSNVDSSLPVVF